MSEARMAGGRPAGRRCRRWLRRSRSAAPPPSPPGTPAARAGPRRPPATSSRVAATQRIVGVKEFCLNGAANRLNPIGTFADPPDGAAAALSGPAGDVFAFHLGQPEQPLQLLGDIAVLAEQDLGVAQVH